MRSKGSITTLERQLGFKWAKGLSRETKDSAQSEPIRILLARIDELKRAHQNSLPTPLPGLPDLQHEIEQLFRTVGPDLWPNPPTDTSGWLCDPAVEDWNGNWTRYLRFDDLDDKEILREHFHALIYSKCLRHYENQKSARKRRKREESEANNLSGKNTNSRPDAQHEQPYARKYNRPATTSRRRRKSDAVVSTPAASSADQADSRLTMFRSLNTMFPIEDPSPVARSRSSSYDGLGIPRRRRFLTSSSSSRASTPLHPTADGTSVLTQKRSRSPSMEDRSPPRVAKSAKLQHPSLVVLKLTSHKLASVISSRRKPGNWETSNEPNGTAEVSTLELNSAKQTRGADPTDNRASTPEWTTDANRETTSLLVANQNLVGQAAQDGSSAVVAHPENEQEQSSRINADGSPSSHGRATELASLHPQASEALREQRMEQLPAFLDGAVTTPAKREQLLRLVQNGSLRDHHSIVYSPSHSAAPDNPHSFTLGDKTPGDVRPVDHPEQSVDQRGSMADRTSTELKPPVTPAVKVVHSRQQMAQNGHAAAPTSLHSTTSGGVERQLTMADAPMSPTHTPIETADPRAGGLPILRGGMTTATGSSVNRSDHDGPQNTREQYHLNGTEQTPTAPQPSDTPLSHRREEKSFIIRLKSSQVKTRTFIEVDGQTTVEELFDKVTQRLHRRLIEPVLELELRPENCEDDFEPFGVSKDDPVTWRMCFKELAGRPEDEVIVYGEIIT
ncbi:uncharacterized protein LTR77_005415 [Saxophila tyrrhenica]|uniref:Uncharacterized protein n=1 Tax=Saxophila tyrrhenica TaxID=1690608 RepID=A0AAV9P8E4_9PEZI|nr:hypothetical protein LTR77_005415 [Saxophila tyrrhenica]